VSTETFTGAGGLELSADRLDGDRDTPIVLLHGGGQTRHSWGPTAAALAGAGWPTLAVDLRGHGDSGWAEDGDYELDSFAGDVAAAARAAGAPPVLVGASLGGFAALRAFELDPPVEAAGLVLVDVAHRFQVAGAERVVSFMGANEGFDDPSEATEAVATYLDSTRERPEDTSGIHKNLRQSEDGRWRWHWDPAMLQNSRGLLDRRHELERGFADTIRRLEIPAILVWGGLSDVVDEEIATELTSLNPLTESVEVPRTGHMIAGDSNDPFTVAVLDFLERRIP
jgi:pimeloyl-ACP methyl ester carboxylesterase